MQGFFVVVEPPSWILAKQNVLCGAFGHSNVQVLRWTPFRIVIINKHKIFNPHCEQLLASC